ncbi:MAG: fatty acid desaturase [Kiritimatiellales bacterium]|nr:fatty acid desaturase [Kiritimatiellales bacterium]
MSMETTAACRIEWYRTPIEKEQFKALTQRSDAKAFLQAGSYLLVIVLTGALTFWVKRNLGWPWLVPALFIHGTVYAFLINAVHELSHGTVFRTKWLNSLFLHIFAFLGLNNHVFFRASHMQHHQHTLYFPQDSEVVLPIKLTLKGFFQTALVNWPRMKWQMGQLLRFAFSRFKGDWECVLMQDDKVRIAVVRWARAMLVGHVVIAVFSLAYGVWLVPVLVTLAPFYGEGLNYLLNNTQHVGLCGDVADFRLCCRTIQVNPLFRFLYWNMNWHTEHHMYAAVPCYNLGKLHRAIGHDLPPAPKGLVETWRQISSILHSQKADPSYQFVSTLPEPG